MPVDTHQGSEPCKLLHIATVDLDPGAVRTLERLGWLKGAKPTSQMDVNEACTLLVLARPGGRLQFKRIAPAG